MPLTSEPDEFALNPKIQRLIKQRREMVEGERPLDWGMAEALACTLLTEDIPVRLPGRTSDAARSATGMRCTRGGYCRRYLPLRKLAPQQADFRIFNSPLTEAAVLGFDPATR